MPTVKLVPAGPDDRQTVENLLQLYTHDFSEHWAGTNLGDVDANGRFAPYPLDAYWQMPSHTPLLFRQEAHLVGFALINNLGHGAERIDRNVAEFFVLRKYRRGGVGTAAAYLMFTRFPGVWEAAVARRNIAALEFWRRTIRSCPAARELKELDLQSDNWNGPVLQFQIVGTVGTVTVT